MAYDDFFNHPDFFDPEIPGAVGSRNSPLQNNRDLDDEAKRIIDEEIRNILGHMESKLPPEVLNRLDVMATIKEKLYNYINIGYSNLMNQHMSTVEDELLKKLRGFIDREERKNLARHSPREITEMLRGWGVDKKMSSAGMEESLVRVYENLQGHVQQGVKEVEDRAVSVLNRKSDVGEFVDSQNAYSVLKCSFRDNAIKPETVFDVKLSINILNSELISPIFHYQVTMDYIIRDVVAKQITQAIDEEIEESKRIMENSATSEMTTAEELFEKLNRIEEHASDSEEDELGIRYRYLSRNIIDRISGLKADIPMSDYDSLGVRENIKKILDKENIRNRGFNTAVNSLASILDRSKMGYRHMENLKNARGVELREYEMTDSKRLPDERYEITLKYVDLDELTLLREAYDQQMTEFNREIGDLRDVVNAIYHNRKRIWSIRDFDDLFRKVKRDIKKLKRLSDPDYEDEESYVIRDWGGIQHIRPEESEIERENRTYVHENYYQKNRLSQIEKRIEKIYQRDYPTERAILGRRLKFLKEKYLEFNHRINPHHIQPGLILDIDIVSIKKKRITLNRMANVLGEFLGGISRGFQDWGISDMDSLKSAVREEISRGFQNN